MADPKTPIKTDDKPREEKHGRSLADVFRAFDEADANEQLAKRPEPYAPMF